MISLCRMIEQVSSNAQLVALCVQSLSIDFVHFISCIKMSDKPNEKPKIEKDPKKKPSGAENRKRRAEKLAAALKNTQNISGFLQKVNCNGLSK